MAPAASDSSPAGDEFRNALKSGIIVPLLPLRPVDGGVVTLGIGNDVDIDVDKGIETGGNWTCDALVLVPGPVLEFDIRKLGASRKAGVVDVLPEADADALSPSDIFERLASSASMSLASSVQLQPIVLNPSSILSYGLSVSVQSRRSSSAHVRAIVNYTHHFKSELFSAAVIPCPPSSTVLVSMRISTQLPRRSCVR